MPNPNEYWFPARKYGLGWGLPVVWQGWAVIAVFVLLIVLGVFIILPKFGPWIFVPYCGVMSGGLVAAGILKGEPLGWRRKNH